MRPSGTGADVRRLRQEANSHRLFAQQAQNLGNFDQELRQTEEAIQKDCLAQQLQNWINAWNEQQRTHPGVDQYEDADAGEDPVTEEDCIPGEKFLDGQCVTISDYDAFGDNK